MVAPARRAPAFAGCLISIDQRGLATLQIQDHTAELHDYSVRPAPAGLDEFACLVQRLDGRGDSAERPYRVAVDRLGRWRCGPPPSGAGGCKSFRHRKGPHGPAGCLHTAAIRPLYLLLRSLLKETP